MVTKVRIIVPYQLGRDIRVLGAFWGVDTVLYHNLGGGYMGVT